jgi:chromosome partitioning protein
VSTSPIEPRDGDAEDGERATWDGQHAGGSQSIMNHADEVHGHADATESAEQAARQADDTAEDGVRASIAGVGTSSGGWWPFGSHEGAADFRTDDAPIDGVGGGDERHGDDAPRSTRGPEADLDGRASDTDNQQAAGNQQAARSGGSTTPWDDVRRVGHSDGDVAGEGELAGMADAGRRPWAEADAGRRDGADPAHAGSPAVNREGREMDTPVQGSGQPNVEADAASAGDTAFHVEHVQGGNAAGGDETPPDAEDAAVHVQQDRAPATPVGRPGVPQHRDEDQEAPDVVGGDPADMGAELPAPPPFHVQHGTREEGPLEEGPLEEGQPGLARPGGSASPVAPQPAPPPPLRRPRFDRARIMAVANQKGGVGKTTTAVSLAAAVAETGAQVLLVDLDPQGNASSGLGMRPKEGQATVYHVLVEGLDILDAVEPANVRNLFVVPTNIDLAGAEVELVSMFSREQRLRRALESVVDEFDLIIIDCPPSLGLLTVNALTAADGVIVPIQCEYYALEGLGALRRNADLVRANLNPGLEITGFVLTMLDARTRLSQMVVDEVKAHFGDRVFRARIPRSVRLAEAPSFGQPITVFDPGSRGAMAYRRLAGELLERLGAQ